MKKNIRILIIVSILGLIALSFIQAYLINNTYKLEKDVFLEETKRTISRFDDDMPIMDSIYDRMFSHLLLKISDYKLNRIDKTELLGEVPKVRDSVNELFINAYQDEFKRRGVQYPLEYQKRLKSLIILDSLKNDTLYFEFVDNKKTFLLGKSFEAHNDYAINNSQVRTDYERDYVEDGVSKVLSYNFQLVTEDYINIDGWKGIVLGRMTSVLVLSILIFSLVIGLLYYSIKSLITQKKIAEVKTDFINNITHELKTPLATLSLSTKMLKKEEVKAQQTIVESTINTIDRQTNRLQKLIDQVLNNSLGYQDIELVKEEVVISDYLNTVLDDFQLSVKNDNVNIQRNIMTDSASAILDKFYFTTGLFNILENAVKYNAGNVDIDFTADLENDLKISITDNGIGISEHNQKQLFEKFYRVGNKEVHDVKGLGLGLYYTNQIVIAHQGKITIESAEGEGAIFTITIPIHKNQ
ncbi:ATP-binding protein [Winogradskyella sp. 3972H.M.0a.05]|uniref:sensor histidine kinase n=1 Tax=Winogradskyella sp. 3972H.M.0a.05 TaxID=2950277 RepID=UPI003394D299